MVGAEANGFTELIFSLLAQDVLIPVFVISEGFRALFDRSYPFFSVVTLDPVD